MRLSWPDQLRGRFLKMTKFPHLLPADCILWQKFLDLHEGSYNRFEYDVRVGEGTDPGDQYDDNMRYDAITLSQRRIDVIGYQAKVITLFEVTTSAGLTALGQLTAYPQLFIKTYSPGLPVKPHLVTYGFQSDIEQIFLAQGIDFTIIPTNHMPVVPEEQT